MRLVNFKKCYLLLLTCQISSNKMSYRELPDVLKAKAKAEIFEDPERTKQDLEHIKEWLKKQPHLNVRTDDQWLISFLRGCKFSLERTKEKIDMFYTMRTVIPEFFNNRDPRRPEIQAILRKGIFLPLELSNDKLAPRIILVRGGVYDPQEINVADVMKANMMLMDISMMEDDYAPVNGVRILQDMAGITLGHIANPSLSKKAMTCFQEGYPNRIKGLYFLNIPSFFETVFNVIKPWLTEKIRSRINIHSDFESVYKDVPKEVLPKEYGGDGLSIDEIIEITIQKMEQYRDWFLEDEKYKTDEKKRPGKPKTADELFGIEGSFRKLNVD